MAKKRRSLDVTSMPDRLRIVEEVNASGEPSILRNGNVDLPPKSLADIDAFKASAGSWSDVDTDKLVEGTRVAVA